MYGLMHRSGGLRGGGGFPSAAWTERAECFCIWGPLCSLRARPGCPFPAAATAAQPVWSARRGPQPALQAQARGRHSRWSRAGAEDGTDLWRSQNNYSSDHGPHGCQFARDPPPPRPPCVEPREPCYRPSWLWSSTLERSYCRCCWTGERVVEAPRK